MRRCIASINDECSGPHWHLDEFVGKRLRRSEWIRLTMAMLRAAHAVIRFEKFQFRAVAVFDLIETRKPSGFRFRNAEEFLSQGSYRWHPPLVAIVPLDKFKNIRERGKRLSNAQVKGVLGIYTDAVDAEWYERQGDYPPPDNVFSRTLALYPRGNKILSV
jgi:hypothetical protein